MAENTNLRMNRREFLKGTGAGIFLYFVIGEVPFFQQEGSGSRVQHSLPTDFNAFLKIGEDGRVSCYTGKIEMGQGPITSLAQELADELDVALDKVDMVMGDTDLCPWDMGTFGSLTTRRFGPFLRMAGAEARGVLLELASEKLNVPIEQLSVSNGEIFVKTIPGRRITYADLAKGRRIDRKLTHPIKTKDPAEFKVMGKPVLRMDALAKVTGKAKYAGDIRIPGMVYAKILRPPAHGAKLVEVDLSAARAIEGVQVIREGDFIAVLHESPDIAEAALARIKARFDVPKAEVNDKTIFEHLLKVAPEGQVISKAGNLLEGEQTSTAILDATYLDGYKAHAPMEPHTAVVQIEGDRATVWPSSQTPFPLRAEIAKELGFPEENVHVISPFVGGGFGGKSTNHQAVEAARCAKPSGKPVQVAWSRKEEFFYDTFRPAAIVKIRSGIKGGTINYWDYHVYCAGERGAQHFYDIPHSRTVVYNAGPGSHPFATGPWRAPGNSTNTFARESQIDAMAAKAGIDPVEFRLRNLAEAKMKGVLQAAAGKFGWKPSRAPSGRGYGVACGFDAGTYVAAIADVSVDKSSGEVKVNRVVCAQDMGLVINPEGATIQMEGCITMGLGYALEENIRFNGGEILDVNFGTYELPRFSWLPEIETVILDGRSAPSQGGGEPAIILMGALVGNAIFDAIGARLYQLPLTAERVRQSLGK
jgi:nicotinate dehydrogenase subunit B